MIDELFKVTELVTIAMYKNTSQSALTVNKLRFKSFMSSVAVLRKKSFLSFLPPTDSALREHTKRVYYQVQLWLGNNSLIPEKWGWMRQHFLVIPTMTDKPSAPESLLQSVRILYACIIYFVY